jgi:protocatechuate 3,4-dioxygenase alpha subunit
LVPGDRRTTLIARRDQGGVTAYRFDVHLQGDDETVFFDL